MEEAGVWASGRQLRDMFASMLMFCEVTNPRQLWDAHWESLSNDIETMTHCERADLAITLSENALKDRALYWDRSSSHAQRTSPGRFSNTSEV